MLTCDIPVLTEFLAEWAAPCQTVAAHLAEITPEYDNRLKLVKVDIEANPLATANYNVFNVPTLVLFKNGQEVERMSGVVSKAEVVAKVMPFLDE